MIVCDTTTRNEKELRFILFHQAKRVVQLYALEHQKRDSDSTKYALNEEIGHFST